MTGEGPGTTRRAALAAALTAAGGCVGLGGRSDPEPPPVQLVAVQFANRTPFETALDVVLRRDGEPVFDETLAFTSIEGDGWARTVEADWPAEPARYELRLSGVDGQTRRASFPGDTDSSERCLFLDVRIEKGGSPFEPSPTDVDRYYRVTSYPALVDADDYGGRCRCVTPAGETG